MDNQNVKVANSTFAEKFMYGIGDAAGAMLLAFPGAYLTLYCTDSLGLSAAFLGTMMLVCRLFDGISDIIMGIIIDRTNTKLGKARPWFIGSVIPLVLSFAALFNVPRSLSPNGQMVYIYVVYFLMTVLFYTINNIGYHAMLQRFSLTPQDRGSVSAVRAFLCVFFTAVMNVVIPITMPILGGETAQHTWSVFAAVLAIVSLVFLGITCAGIKEKLPCEAKVVSEEEKKQKRENNKKALGFLLKSKYFYVLILLSLVWFASFNMMGINYYYAREILGSGELSSVLIMAGMVPCLVIMPFVGKLFAKFGKQRTVQVGLIIAALASVAVWIQPSNLVLNILSLAIKCIASAPLMAGVATLAGDVTDFCEKKSGIRTEGLTTSAYSVGVKIGTGLGGAFVAWGIALGHYDYTLPVQTDATKTAIIITFCVVPAVLYALGAVLMSFWDVEKKLHS